MSKNIINQELASSSSLSPGISYPADNFALPPQDIKFPGFTGEGFSTDYKVRSVPVSPPGRIAGVIFTKLGNVVHMTIPSFHGTLVIGNVSSVIRCCDHGRHSCQLDKLVGRLQRIPARLSTGVKTVLI